MQRGETRVSVYVIAEAGVNHNGNLDLAKRLVEEAKKAGADCIKFQTYKAKNIVSKKADKADYQKRETGTDENQYEMLKKLELSYKEFGELKAYCDAMKIDFMSTPFDHESIEYLKSLDMPCWKIPSGEITNLPYLMKIAQIGEKIILSTGMSDIHEVRESVTVLKKYNVKEIIVLHCTTEYPTPYDEVNLNAMITMRDEFNLPIGYSDHTQGSAISVAAVSLGATVIEKHLTLNRGMKGPDHKASLEPHEFKAMVQAIRNVEVALGHGEKVMAECEQKNKQVARKSIVAKKDIKKGEVFSEENLTIKRPGNGISPMRWFALLGTTSKRNYKEDEMIKI